MGSRLPLRTRPAKERIFTAISRHNKFDPENPAEDPATLSAEETDEPAYGADEVGRLAGSRGATPRKDQRVLFTDGSMLPREHKRSGGKLLCPGLRLRGI